MKALWDDFNRVLDKAPGAPWWYFAALVVAVVVVRAWMARAGRAMTSTGGTGIVGYKLAEDVREVHRIFTRWGQAGCRAARASLRIDFLWLVLYTAALTWAVLAVGADSPVYPDSGLAHMLRWSLAFGAVAAGALDAVENVALLRQLRTGPRQRLVYVARLAAQVKLALVGIAFLYVLGVFGWTRLFG